MPKPSSVSLPPVYEWAVALSVSWRLLARLARFLRLRARWRVFCAWLASCDVRGHSWDFYDADFTRVWHQCERCGVIGFGGTGKPSRFECWRARG